MSILSFYERAPEGYRAVYIRARGIDRGKLSQLKEDLREMVDLISVIDHQENTREIYKTERY